jgi:hypothetical protein
MINMHKGFTQYKSMFDAGQIRSGQTISVQEGNGSLVYYQVSPLEMRNNQQVYVLRGGSSAHNAKNVLQGRNWDIEGIQL